MASYQDLETQLNVLSDKLHFIMSIMRMSAAVPTGLLDQNGQQSFRKQEGTMLEWYHLAKSGGLDVVTQSDAPPPSLEAPLVESL